MAPIDFQAVLQSSTNAYMVLDPELRYVWANDAYLRVTGSSLDALVGRHLLDVFPNDPAQPDHPNALRLRDSLRRVLDTGRPDVVPVLAYRVPREDGSTGERYWSATHTPIRDASGEVSLVLQHTVEVTEIRELERVASYAEAERAELLERERAAWLEAEEADRRHRFLAELIPQQVWTALPSGQLDFVNSRVLAYFGATHDEMLGSGWQSHVHPDDLPHCLAAWLRSLETGAGYDVEFRLLDRHGVYRWHIGRALSLRDESGAILQWFGSNTDIDEAKKARDELQHRAEFEQQLIGIVSHDLRNPLNAIALSASLLQRRGGLDEPQRKGIARIVSASDRAARLIRDLLDFTRARQERGIPITRGEADLREIAHHVVDEVRLSYPDRHATVEHCGRAQGRWDADRLAQLLGNLVNNAFQHSPPGATVGVRVSGDADAAIIEVHNDGPPIPDADRERLFEPFRRGIGANTGSGSSVGLGLYIARLIVAAHGGSIDVTSEAGSGTRFVVRLPWEVPASAP